MADPTSSAPRDPFALPPGPPDHTIDYAELMPEEPVPLRAHLAMLRRHAWFVFGAVAVSLAITGYLLSRQRPEYEANVVVRLVDVRRALTGGLGGAAVEEAVGRQVDPMASEIQILLSRGVLGEVVAREGLRLVVGQEGFPLDLLRDPRVDPGTAADTLRLHFAADGFVVVERGQHRTRAGYGTPVEMDGVRFTIAERPPIDEAVFRVIPEITAIEALRGRFRAQPREGTNVIDLRYLDYAPARAQRVANAVASAFQAHNTRAAQEESQRRRVFLEEQFRLTETRLAGAQAALSEFRRREEVYSSREKFAAQQSGLMGLEVRLEELAADRAVYRSLLAGVERQGSGESGRGLRALVSSPGIAANPVISQLYGQLVQYETALDSLTTGEWASAPTNPDVQRLSGLAATSRGKIVEAVRSHLASLDARIASLDELQARSAEQIRLLPESESEEVALIQEVETIRRLADRLRGEHQQARIAEAVAVGQVDIVDWALPPAEPIPARRGRRVVFGLLLGLVAGVGGALVLENLNTSLRRKEEVERVLRVPGLAVIPRIRARSVEMPARISLPRRRRLPATRPGDEWGAELVTLHDLRSGGAEAYRVLRTNLIFSQAVHSLKTIVVASAAPGEGKTTTAANLAVAFAQQGMRSLLVDCDLRCGRLHTVFDVDAEPGLTELALGRATPSRAVRGTPVEGLYLLTTGTLPPNPADLLGLPAMRQTLAYLAGQFDLLVLDTPPLTAAPDAAVLGARADGVVMVVRAGRTDREAARYAIHQLHAVGARVIGTVLNDPDAEVQRYGGHYHAEYYGA